MSAMLIQVRREPFSPYYQLIMPNGNSEEILCEDIYEWFRLRGAKAEVIEKAIDEAWNFYSVDILVPEWREPSVQNPRISPHI